MPCCASFKEKCCRCCTPKLDNEEPRKIVIGSPLSNEQYCKNQVVTSKYTVANFVFKNLFEQFRRIANFYFLIISILQLSTNLSPTSQYATILPLCVVLFVTMIKEIIEDYRRHEADYRINKATAHVLRGTEMVDVMWSEVGVGDIIQIFNKESVPADFVILSASGENGICYIETSNLDGETNLKLRTALHDLNHLNSPASLSLFQGTLLCENPNPHLYSFEGTIQTVAGAQLPLGFENVVWRGCRILNTKWVFGLVVFSGQDTKLIMNSRPALAKVSNVERQVNAAIGLIFLSLIILCCVSTVLGAWWLGTSNAQGAWYLTFIPSQTTYETAASWVTFLILYNNLVPISLYVSLELVKAVQAQLISSDLLMYHRNSGSRAEARTSNLNEDLGQIEYIFSDKTGTLTCNEMEFRKCSVGGILYGERVEDLATPRTNGAVSLKLLLKGKPLPETARPIPEESSPTTASFLATMSSLPTSPVSVNSNSAETPLVDVRAANSSPLPLRPNQDEPVKPRHVTIATASDFAAKVAKKKKKRKALRIQEAKDTEGKTFRRMDSAWNEGLAGYSFNDATFLSHLHDANHANSKPIAEFLTALSLCHTVIPDKNEAGEIIFQASSPDEAALVTAAKHLGWDFIFRGNKFVIVNQQGTEVRYEVLNINEFHSDRKRMSVLVRDPNGVLILYCKGADEVMVPLLRNFEQEDVMIMQGHLTQFSVEGLRTMVVAKRVVDPDVYARWNAQYVTAQNQLENRELQLRFLASEIERDMDLLGATAIEDKLQEGVPETIEKLTKAGIKVWMLTGDKLETAENIGFSCRLLDDTLHMVKVDENTAIKTHLAMARAVKRYKAFLGTTNDKLGLLITGQSLTFIFADIHLRSMFLQLCRMCKVVVACRVIPSQKAEIVRTVRSGFVPQPLTLAIGDGANDVAMIQEAHVGVGISGNEGMQAVRASDYSFAQFRFLQRLLLVHGRWNYRRVSVLILYCFYKNIMVVMTLFFFSFLNGYSGTTLYESWLAAGWNVGWTLFPILFFGIFEQGLRFISFCK